MSRVGQKVISLPDKVSVNVGSGGEVTVEGPKGKLQWQLPEGISIELLQAGDALPVCEPWVSMPNIGTW